METILYLDSLFEKLVDQVQEQYREQEKLGDG